MSRQNVLLVAAATFVSAALILPTSGVLAQNWTTVTMNHMPIVNGSGHVVQQSRAVGNFQRVETLGSENVDIRFGPRAAVVIAADDNILPLITSEVRGGTLKVGTRGSFRMRGPIRVWITVPSLQSFESSGSGNVRIHDVNSRGLKLALNGSGDIRANGRTARLDLDIRGSGRAQLAQLAAGDATVGLYGSGEAIVRASGMLDARVFGSGTVRYIGNPAHMRRSRFGSGSIVASR